MTHTPRKRFGQNFLHDYSIISDIISSLGAQTDEHWVEIGPGMGALTGPLLKMGLQLDVVELDRDLVSFLTDKFSQASRLTIHSADALKFDFAQLAKPDEKLRVIGNLPYNISTPLLFHLLENMPCIADMHFMLQKEVVDRICAIPNNKQYGRLSVMMQYYCEPELLFVVPPESFDPAPKVLSAVVKLTPHQQPPVGVRSTANLSRIVTEAFSQRRKTLRNALSKVLTSEQIQAAGIDPTARAETLALADFARLSELLA
jgi:16S rRNA (adenine1518-N6/adenine1519-N6)-dimethyltransferase